MEHTLSIQDIMKILPHRYPFLLVDRATIIEVGKEAEGIKNFTINEPFFTGHFPNQPIVPGVLLIEALAQLTAILYSSNILFGPEAEKGEIRTDNIAEQIGYIAKINEFKFKKLVIPGDQVHLCAKVSEEYGMFIKTKVSAYIIEADKKVKVVEGTITVTRK